PFIKSTSIKVSTPPSPDGEGEMDAARSKILASPHLPVFLKLYRFPSPLGEGLGVRAMRAHKLTRACEAATHDSQNSLHRCSAKVEANPHRSPITDQHSILQQPTWQQPTRSRQ